MERLAAVLDPDYAVVSADRNSFGKPSAPSTACKQSLCARLQTEQGLECAAHTVMGSDQPLLHVANGLIRHNRLATLPQFNSQVLAAGHLWYGGARTPGAPGSIHLIHPAAESS